MIILGNGFTIDFLKQTENSNDIDVVNLFSKGSHVNWPTTEEPGFLSYKNCPNLWNLGVRPTLNSQETIGLIEDIITCANVYESSDHRKKPIKNEHQLYIKAYTELTMYLRHLFVMYDGLVKLDVAKTSSWHWADFFNRCYYDPQITEVNIVTYNYDVFLERTLKLLNIPFDIGVIGQPSSPTAKFQIFKPHGSISFLHEKFGAKDAFNIPYERDIGAESREFKVGYDDLNFNYLMNPIIPPAGDSKRITHNWAVDIKNKAKEKAAVLNENDLLVVCGISYWHVDRAEIDELLTCVNSEINVRMINPAPPRAMSAVLTSLFKNYVEHVDGAILKKLKLV